MSFSIDVKKEISDHLSRSFHCRAAELGGILSALLEVRHEGDSRKIVIKTEHEFCFDKMHRLFNILFGITKDMPGVICKVSNDVYRTEINDEKLIYSIFQTLKLSEENEESVEHEKQGVRVKCDGILIERSCCKRAFLRGSFIASGSINNPEKAYHMEIVCHSEEKAKQLIGIIQSFDIEAKMVKRKKYFVVYIKEGTAIIDVLNVMGAHVALMNMENVRIVKDIRNSINRKVNCEAANLNKTVNAAVKQKEDILYIKNTKGIDYLPMSLKQVALIRLSDTEISLKEIGEMLNPPIGKSGVNHRLRKISEIAEKLRGY